MEEKINMNRYPNRHGTTINIGFIITKLRGLCMPNNVYENTNTIV